MIDTQIYELAKQFRIAIENARNADRFVGDDFDRFPKSCCGDTSCLLAEHLCSRGLESIYVWGEDDTKQTHAWLVMDDDRVRNLIPTYINFPDNVKDILNSYSNETIDNSIVQRNYDESDIADGLIVDITADQFDEVPIYVGYIRDFYRRFEFRSASKFTGLGSNRLRNIYQIILQYIY